MLLINNHHEIRIKLYIITISFILISELDKNSLIAPLTPGQTDYILSDLPTEPQVQQVQQPTSNPTPDWAKQ